MALINEDDNQDKPLTTQGGTADDEKQPGDTTELRQDQNDVAPTEDNPNHIENADDLHEIQVDDDLNEPDADEYQPGRKDDNESFDNTLSSELDEDTP